MKTECSVIILAAGNSERMGQVKFGLRMGDGKMFLEHILQQFSAFGCTEIAVVVNNAGLLLLEQQGRVFSGHIRFVVNRHPEYGSFYSLKQGLSAISEKQFVFIHNADNPFAEEEVLENLYKNRLEDGIVKPVYKEKGGHPVLIGDTIRNAIHAETGNDIRLDNFLGKFPQKKINVSTENILVNVNMPEDYRNL